MQRQHVIHTMLLLVIQPFLRYQTPFKSCGYSQVYIFLIFKPSVMVNSKAYIKSSVNIFNPC